MVEIVNTSRISVEIVSTLGWNYEHIMKIGWNCEHTPVEIVSTLKNGWNCKHIGKFEIVNTPRVEIVRLPHP